MSRLFGIAHAVFVVATIVAQSGPLRPHPLGPVEARSKELLSTVSQVRALSDGRLLVLDLGGRKLVLIDRDLTSWRVVADSTEATGNAFASPAAGLIAYKGDSSLFVEPGSLAMLVVSPTGDISRVISIPKPGDALFLTAAQQNGFAAVDPQGRLIYRGRAPAGPPPRCNADGTQAKPRFSDVAPLVRIDFSTRIVDTLASLKVSPLIMHYVEFPIGVVIIANPMPQGDDWAMLSDGTVIIIRGADYHVDVVTAPRAATSSPKLQFDWIRMTDSSKRAFVDSTRVAAERNMPGRSIEVVEEPDTAGSLPLAMSTRCHAATPPTGVEGGGAGSSGGGIAAARPNPEARSAPQPAPAARPQPPTIIAGPTFLPDYAPPFSPGEARADLSGHVWVRTSVSIGGGPVYDVIDRTGSLVDRVIIPAGRVIVGFGPAGKVYMGVRDGRGTRLEQARWELKRG